MPSKLQSVTKLYKYTLKDISNSPENWASFLITASNNYKYSFDEQILIFAQRPEATACADIDTWNEKVKRWVNKGAKGIALLDEVNDKLRYVFDVSDTHNYRGTKLNLWKVDKKYNEEIIETLEANFGELENKIDLAEAIISASYNSVEDNLQDYLDGLISSKTNSFLEELDNFNIEVKFRSLLSNSVAYITMQRCGINPFNYFSLDDFREIIEFNTIDTLAHLGTATSDIAEKSLREIHKTIKYLQLKEKNKNRIFANKEILDDTIINKENERSVSYESRIQSNRRLSNTKFNSGGNERESNSGQILSDEIKLFKGKQKRSIYGFKNEKRAFKSSIQYTNRSNKESRKNYGRNDGKREYNRRVEESKSNEMGSNDEQFETFSRGNSDSRSDLQLNLPTEEEQKQKIADTDITVPAIFEFTQEMIDRTLQDGSNFEDSKFRIYKQMTSSMSSKENIKFLKNEYGIGGSSSAYNGANFGQEHSAKGIKLYQGYKENRPEKLLAWNVVEKRLKELVSTDRYLNSKEQEEYNKWLEREDKEEHDIIEISVEKVLDYHLGDIVYIGCDQYEISNIGISYIQLYDLKFPLLSKEIPKEEFERILKENPSNSHLLKLKEIDNIAENVLNEIVDNAKDFSKELTSAESKLLKLENEYDIFDREESSIEQVREDLKNKDELIDYLNLIKDSEDDNEELQNDIDDVIASINESNIINPNFDKKIIEKDIAYHQNMQEHNKINFKITDNDLGIGSAKEKFINNIEAIKTLKKCEKENRLATAEEQEILSKYVGWGGLAKVFDGKDSNWFNEYNALKSILSEEEYKDARSSTLTAFYTPPIVTKSIYKVLENMGVKKANILEPSCGIGNFLGNIPDSMNESKLYGIEIDSISGRIARQLYQKSNITISGYENVELPDSFFDIALGNVPFGDYKLLDKRYDKHKFLIHDYFFAKTLDKVRPGGVICFITSKGTLDKENPSVRKYIAQRADLLGAIRLPNNTFKDNAGTKVTSDIIFLQKRDSITDLEPDWIYLDTDENGIKMNKYFVDNPDMICGNMIMDNFRFGMEPTCEARTDISLEEQLNDCIQNIRTEVKEYEIDDIGEDEEDLSIPADYNVRNFSYTLVEDKIYYRENSKMYPQELPLTTENRVKGLIEIRECVRTLLELQTEDFPEEYIKQEQVKLNKLYDSFTKKYGLINSRANTSAFSNDNSFYLLCSLEILDENKELLKKADMFTKRTILPHKEITSVDTANEALIVSISEKARVDIEFMQSLCGLDMDKMLNDLEGVIFNVPEYGESNIWVTADEYLSANIREKLKKAKEFAETDPKFNVNVKYLEEVMPKDLEPQEIAVRLGATWLPPDVIDDFIDYLLSPSWNIKNSIKVHFMESTAQWNIEGKNYDRGNVKAHATYGTGRINAYKIIEETLNLKDVRIYDYNYDENGKKIQELNKKETAIAQAKQEQIKTAFDEWIWNDVDRRERLSKIYNEKFNSNRPREYDGSHINFHGMNPEITLRPHQVNAIARILYGNSNTLLAHEVGAGKTFEMVAAAMESKRLGLCNKSMFVVPNHIVEQFSSEFLQLYPSANILVTTKKDFETANRKKFCSRIATGDYDAVIISHSQFEKIPMSVERQKIILQNQINDITMGVQDLKENNGENFTIKQLVRLQKSLETKLDKLNDTSRKDDVVTFEELGVDRIFVDEAHYYKNLFLYTKMRNVGGIAQTEAQKSSDLFMKCRYLDELTGGRGVVFATGTPVSNSMVELYTMQRYLQYAELEKRSLQQFDAWASTFGETVTAIELNVMKMFDRKNKAEYQKVA